MNNLDLYFSLKVVRINTYKLSKYRVFRRMRYLSNESRCKREIGINDKNRDNKQLKNAFFFTDDISRTGSRVEINKKMF